MTTPVEVTTCPIWGTKYEAKGTYDPETRTYEVTDSERAFTGYKIRQQLLDLVEQMSNSKKAQLTTWLIDQFSRGNEQPEVTLGVLLEIGRNEPLPVHIRADRLLKLVSLTTRSQQLGEFVSFPLDWYYPLAWSESIDPSDVRYLLEYLQKMGWLERNPFGNWRVSVEGHTRVDELQRNEKASDSSQAFIAMWFHDSMNEAFDSGIEPAIREAGYNPVRIDRVEHVNKIDDEIIAAIRRSRFLVAGLHARR